MYIKKIKRGPMKNITLLLLLFSYFLAAPISANYATIIAENFYYYKNDPRSNSFSNQETQPYLIDEENIFFIVELSPRGFILISSDDLVRPILAYSFEENFRYDNIPVNIEYLFNLYGKQIREQQEARTAQDEFITDEWDKFSRFVESDSESLDID